MVYGAAAIMDEVEFAAKYLNAGLTYLQSYLERKRVSGETEGRCTTMWRRHAWMAADLYRRISGDDSLVQARIYGKSFPSVFRLMAPGRRARSRICRIHFPSSISHTSWP